MLRRLFAPKLTLSHPLSVRRAADCALRFESLEGRTMLSATAAGDFNGDGRADFVTGVPYEDVVVAGSEVVDAGIVQVLYGTASGLASAGNQLWSQNSLNIADTVEGGDRFGWAVAAGDFNGDGFDDLAISAIGESLAGQGSAGSVQILYGSVGGLASPSTAGANYFHQNTPQMLDDVEQDDYFGWTLAAGDFDGDGDDDLAIGIPFETVNAHLQAGAVQVLYGTAGGLTVTGNQFWHQDRQSVADSAEDFDQFGTGLAAGDFDGDGDDDLAIGVPGDGITGADFIGTVHVLDGGVSGLTADSAKFWHQNKPGLAEVAESFDGFGATLAAGDYNGDGKDDLAIGIPNEATSFVAAGAVQILYGTNASLTGTGSTLIHQNTAGVLDSNEFNDDFGASLESGDFNGDGRDDLAVGAPGEQHGPSNELGDAGHVHVFYGSAAGVATAGNQNWTQNSPGILDVVEDGDRFGYYLSAGDFDGDGRADLAIAAPAEDLGQANGIVNAGAFNVIYGTIDGLDDEGNQFWHQNISGVLDDIGRGDGYPTFDAIVPAIAPASAGWWIDIGVAAPAAKKLGRSRPV